MVDFFPLWRYIRGNYVVAVDKKAGFIYGYKKYKVFDLTYRKGLFSHENCDL